MFHIITSQLTGRAKCYHHITFILLQRDIFRLFRSLNRHTPKILHFDLIAKRAAGLFWNGKHILHTLSGHFISG